MSRAQWLLLAAAACAALAGSAPLDALPYAYEIEDTVLLRTLGVDVGTQSLTAWGSPPPAASGPPWGILPARPAWSSPLRRTPSAPPGP